MFLFPLLLRRTSQTVARPKPQRIATQPTTPPMMAPRLFVMPPLLDWDCPPVSVADPNPELLEAGLVLFGGFEGVEARVAAGSEPPVLGEVDDVDEGDVVGLVDVDVTPPSGSMNGVVKPMKWSSVMSFAQAQLVTGSTADWWVRIAVEQWFLVPAVLSWAMSALAPGPCFFSWMPTPDSPADSRQRRPLSEATSLGANRAIDATAHHAVRWIANGGRAECPEPRVDDKVKAETGSPYPPGISAEIYGLKPGGHDLCLEESFFHGQCGDIPINLVPAEEGNRSPWRNAAEK